ncbi:MAG: hypothetical protein HOP12_16310, partial [Candidatus Eisenbacteria bacterium]|nr:hypothetical protein [Candidatus Eisenbacteria bacterium]
MPDDPQKSARRPLIIPGQSEDPPPRKPVLLGASGQPLTSESFEPEPPRIVLPPGAAAASLDDIPEHPRLRPVMIVPVRERGQDLLLVTDPLGVLPSPIALRIEVLDFLQLLDGRFSITELSAEIARASRDVRAGAWVREFVAQLDRMLLLESPRFEDAYRQLRDAFHQLEVRQAALRGVS